VETGLGDDVDFDRGVTTRVVNRAGVDLGDGHCDCGRQGQCMLGMVIALMRTGAMVGFKEL
jgi:hypothetical protein